MPGVTVGKAISILRSAIINSRIYPKGSQMIESSIQAAQQAFQSCLEESPQLTLSDIQGKLCLNGKELAEARDFRPFLAQHEVQSLKFASGLSVQEVSTLVDGLGRKKGQFESHKNVGEWLKAQGVTHVQVEEIHYVALQKGDMVVQQVTQLIDQAANDTSSLVTSLDESYRLIDQVPDTTTKQKAQKQIAQRIAALPPYQIKELFDSHLPDAAEKAGLRDSVVQMMSKEKLEETLEEVNKWYHQIKEESKSEFEVVEKMNNLKSFLGKILHSPASKTVPFSLYEELLNVGVLEAIPPGVEKGEFSSLLAQVDQMVSQDSASLLEPATRQKFPDLLRGLCAMGHDEPLQKLTNKMLDNLKNQAPVVREAAVKTLRMFEEIFTANRKERPFLSIVEALRQFVESESAPDVYGEATQALQFAATELLVNWRFEESAMLLALLRRHSRPESPIGDKKRQLAAKALRDFAMRGLDTLCADLLAPLKDRQNGSYRVLAELGEEAVGPLLETLKRSADPRSRQAALHALNRLGPSVKEPLIKFLSVSTPTETLAKIIPLLSDYADASLLPMLTALLQHPDGAVRRALVPLVLKIKDPKAQPLLAGLLDDPDAETQSEAVRAIAESRLAGFSDELLKRLPSVAPVVQEEICIALGFLVERKAVPAFAKLLQSKASFWRRSSGVPENVKVRAAWALGQLLPNAEAERTLISAQKDANPAVQRAAQAALKKRAAVSA